MTSDFSDRSGVKGWCFSPTSTRNSSSGLALKEVGVCSWHSSILLQTAVQFHMEPILILLLHGSALSILSPFLCTFKQTIRNTIFTLFLTNSFGYIVTLFDANVLCQQRGAHLHQRKLQTSPEEYELDAVRAE